MTHDRGHLADAKHVSIDTKRLSVDAKRLSIDTKRVGIQAGFACMVWAPVAHYWYLALDRVVSRVARSGTRQFVVAKLALEFAFFHPVFLLAFFGGIGIAHGEPLKAVHEQIRHDMLPSLALEWAIWLPVDCTMFAFVPSRHQLLVVNCGCFVDSIALSYIKANGFSLPGH